MLSRKTLAAAKELLKQEIRTHSVGVTIRFPVADEANLEIFKQALNAGDIQRMLAQKHQILEFHIPDVIEQAKQHMLKIIGGAPKNKVHIVFPFLHQDAADAKLALTSYEVQQALQRREITAEIRAVDSRGKPIPDILIATVEDVALGKLDDYLRRIEHE
jgi:hypothetical protein